MPDTVNVLVIESNLMLAATCQAALAASGCGVRITALNEAMTLVENGDWDVAVVAVAANDAVRALIERLHERGTPVVGYASHGEIRGLRQMLGAAAPRVFLPKSVLRTRLAWAVERALKAR